MADRQQTYRERPGAGQTAERSAKPGTPTDRRQTGRPSDEQSGQSGGARNIRVRSGVRLGAGSMPHSRRRKQPNYRLMLCIAVLVSAALALLFFALFLGQRGKVKDLEENVAKLTQSNESLSQEKNMLTQQNQVLSAGIMDALPDPTTANTESLSELIPQLTDAVYVVHSVSSSEHQYIKVPEGYLQDQLIVYRDAGGYAATTGDPPACSYYVLYSDRVIGLAEGDKGYISTERATTGDATTLPAGFYQFVNSFFN